MKLNAKQVEALKICIQAIITALLLFVQSLLGSCVSADNGGIVNIDKQTEINIPIELPNLELQDLELEEFPYPFKTQ